MRGIHGGSKLNPSIILPKQPHPLHQIAETPTHRLLLKQWAERRRTHSQQNILQGDSDRLGLGPIIVLSVFDGDNLGCSIKTDVEVQLEKLLEREKEDGKLLGKCVEELKKKGVEFDLLKEVDALRRAKSLRVEAKAVRKWSARDLLLVFLHFGRRFILDSAIEWG
ncbi:zinc finger protein CONSTANS-LIKE 4-like [Hibiscus syriacus]|uniref:Zinc finger protein CONSTANS-LIKE 4-like n=1 Tax=Hibiscus syriacus TaxID=106335 RepID=A0A6A3CQK8_HIBSY|nr:zinc finger protein CONSTANS-LIKE 4-like [Hibiscus syriacus]